MHGVFRRGANLGAIFRIEKEKLGGFSLINRRNSIEENNFSEGSYLNETPPSSDLAVSSTDGVFGRDANLGASFRIEQEKIVREK